MAIPTRGAWWASKISAVGSDGKCLQSDPCTWPRVLANWPDASIGGNVLFKAGGGWSKWTGNVDPITIAISGRGAATYDFEPAGGEGDQGGDGGNDQSGGE